MQTSPMKLKRLTGLMLSLLLLGTSLNGFVIPSSPEIAAPTPANSAQPV